MKIKDDFVMRKMADTTVVVPVGSNAIDFNGMINLNETGAFLFEILQQGATNDKLVSKLLDEYDVSREQACKDIDIFVKKLKDADIIE